tara:strand:+ start:1273 stop:1965 length:693 start_codon:yes stop_codon:yes gene_type:complete
MKFSIVIPLYNEEDNIELLIKEINEALFNLESLFEIILVDDGSEDNTIKIIKSINSNNLIIVQNSKNYGQSYSLREGIKRANNNIIVVLDGDMQNNPHDISALIDLYKTGSFHLIGGIRRKRRDNFIKIFSSYIANKIRMFILKDDCIDTGCSLKVFDKNIFLKFPYFDGLHRFLPALFKGYGYKTSFVEVDHRKRYRGSSKYGTLSRLFWGVRDIFKVIKIINKNKINE